MKKKKMKNDDISLIKQKWTTELKFMGYMKFICYFKSRAKDCQIGILFLAQYRLFIYETNFSPNQSDFNYTIT